MIAQRIFVILAGLAIVLSLAIPTTAADVSGNSSEILLDETTFRVDGSLGMRAKLSERKMLTRRLQPERFVVIEWHVQDDVIEAVSREIGINVRPPRADQCRIALDSDLAQQSLEIIRQSLAITISAGVDVFCVERLPPADPQLHADIPRATLKQLVNNLRAFTWIIDIGNQALHFLPSIGGKISMTRP